jgi:hypothetical protein
MLKQVCTYVTSLSACRICWKIDAKICDYLVIRAFFFLIC